MFTLFFCLYFQGAVEKQLEAITKGSRMQGPDVRGWGKGRSKEEMVGYIKRPRGCFSFGDKQPKRKKIRESVGTE